jgi:tetratricopeptide (TPR) repeat protein
VIRHQEPAVIPELDNIGESIPGSFAVCRKPMNKLSVLGLTLICVAACLSTPQSDVTPGTSVPAFVESIDLRPDALGDYSWTITTSNEEAQSFFNQGMQLRWAYNVNEAARSMATARRLDPECAMCYWGEAFALGSFLNGGMTAEKAPYAHAAIVRASELAAAHANELEQDLIAAAQVRYPDDYDPDNRRPVDEAFAAAMAKVHEKYPGNHDVATIYAVALFMLEERRGERDVNDPDVIRLHRVLTGVLDVDIRHPGACHLYIHATESSQHPEWALPCAEYLSEAVRVASHIQHMPSHTWNEVGMWGRSVRANTSAWRSDQKAAANQGFSYGPWHNLHMLLFAASYDGQGAVATQAGRDYRKVTDNSMYELLTLVRFGRFDEVIEKNNRPEDEVGAALWDFSYGYASLKQGDKDTATRMRDRSLEFAATTDQKFRFHPAGHVVGTVAHILEGEILWSEGDLGGAIDAFEKAVEIEDSMLYDEPEPLPFAARHWLGAALLEAERFADAERVYRQELGDHPHNGWSLFGLRAALQAKGRNDPEADRDFEESWARSDVWITSSRF